MELGHLLAGFPKPDDPDLIVGFDTSDDAGVYRLDARRALVQTVDLITPVCDDPYAFGQVAAANSLSDVYAMGGRPLTALNICCFPGSGVPEGVFAEILRGGHDKLREAGAVLLGGHTVKDAELKYGLSVTGLVDPERVLRNAGARPGEALVLTKPVGTGLMITAARKEMLPQARIDFLIARMAALNAEAGRLAVEHGASACTDITGFGLAGHALEISRAGGVGLRMRLGSVPFYEEAIDLARRGLRTGVTAANRDLAGDRISFEAAIDDSRRALFFDPQTSGGLLISLPADRAPDLVSALRAGSAPETAIVGDVLAFGPARLEILC